MRIFKGFALAAWVSVSGVSTASAQQVQSDIINPEGKTIGKITVNQLAEGVLIHLNASLSPGVHAMHLHEVGTCQTPDFKSAGGHFNPQGHHHGLHQDGAPHAGDLPNLYVGESGQIEQEIYATWMNLSDGDNALLDEDGSTVIIHAGADDYRSDPAGNAGPRIGCAALKSE